MALACQKRKERMPEIGDAVAKSDYDIVAFQEVIRFLFTTFLHSDRYKFTSTTQLYLAVLKVV